MCCVMTLAQSFFAGMTGISSNVLWDRRVTMVVSMAVAVTKFMIMVSMVMTMSMLMTMPVTMIVPVMIVTQQCSTQDVDCQPDAAHDEDEFRILNI